MKLHSCTADFLNVVEHTDPQRVFCCAGWPFGNYTAPDGMTLPGHSTLDELRATVAYVHTLFNDVMKVGSAINCPQSVKRIRYTHVRQLFNPRGPLLTFY